MSTEIRKFSTGVNEKLQQRRAKVAEARSSVCQRRTEGESGIAVAQWFSDQIDGLLQEITVERASAGVALLDAFALAAVGGNGRRRPAPYSDVDLLFVVDPKQLEATRGVLSAIVRDCWDTGLQIGHSIRTPADVISFAGEDIQFATSLVQLRFLAGNQRLLDAMRQQIHERVFRNRHDRLIERCVTSRREEWMARGNSVNQLEPDVKRSPGGLRDLHLMQWVTCARYGSPELEKLVEHGEISTDELAALNHAEEFLTALRLDLHCATRLKQDVLTRELQLKVASHQVSSAIPLPQNSDLTTKLADPRSEPKSAENAAVNEMKGPADGMRAVEGFMHDYFSVTSRVAEITRRVAEVPRKPSFLSRLKRRLLPQKSPQGFIIQDGTLLVSEEQYRRIKSDPQVMMDLFATAAEHKLILSPELRQFLGNLSPALPAEVDREVSKRFRDVLRFTEGLPNTLRAMYETGVLEWLIPCFAGIRCLIQFNQYHSFTVDEHTLKAMDEVVSFVSDDSPVGSAYRSVRHRATLHLAILMHDVGKGREGDHSIVGEQLCEEVAVRQQLAENKKTMLKFLVRHHLVMPNLAFRRDTTDSAVLVEFARLVGAPELLRMLYVLTVADIRAVGPDVWSDWKGELLADLYSRAMQILSGRPYNYLEQERLKIVRETVRASIVPVASHDDAQQWPVWIEHQLDALPAFYLMTENPDRIARDLDMIQQLSESEVKIEGEYDPETDTVSYRVFAPERYTNGSFHKVAGILSGLRMNILAAQICTTADSIVIASFRVSDNDFTGTVPESRIEDVAVGICDVLTARKTVESVFRRSSLFRLNRKNPLVIRTEPQVSFDNDCSERFTVIDVFASDSQGLLYTLAFTLHQYGLQVQLARIATHIDQVVDVFYVVDQDQKKLEDPARLEALKKSLLSEIRQLSGQSA